TPRPDRRAHRGARRALMALPSAPLPDPLPRIAQILGDSAGLQFDPSRLKALQAAAHERARVERCPTLEGYLALLQDPTRGLEELRKLTESVTIHETSFFRNHEHYRALRELVLPDLAHRRARVRRLRIWSAGCATGEEAFTAAILLAEVMGDSFLNQEVKIFGTDMDESAVVFARHGIYPHDRVRAVAEPLLKKWFVRESGGWAVRKELRRSVVFGVNNLVSDPPISRLDLLICRNVFIYLDAGLQKRVLTRFHYAIRQHGVLVLGRSELIPFAAKLFEPVDLHQRIYRKDGHGDLSLTRNRAITLLEHDNLAGPGEESNELATAEAVYRDAVSAMRTPVITTAADGTVTAWNAAAAVLWGRSEEQVVGRKLTTLALAGLSGELLVEKTAAVREGRSDVERSTAAVTRPADQRALQLAVEVTPLRNLARRLVGLLYVAYDVTAFRELEAELRKANAERQSALEELQTSNEELQSANEEMETTNEELQSTNEELQTTNEELETTNEELQSTNAELDSTNRELGERTGEVNAAGYVQRAIIRTVTAAVVVLDQGGRVRVWNLAAERLLGISEDEALGQVLWTLQIPSLPRSALQKIRKALTHNGPLRAEQVSYTLPNGSEGRATVAAVPVVEGGKTVGAVIILDDITRLASLASEVAALKAKHGGKPKQN
ncbi:MAG TPA: CheR family methyltransferase, partial [Myxococcales bacterium]|nr:CheR family methyltransferase [Myxococcales bacterium]